MTPRQIGGPLGRVPSTVGPLCRVGSRSSSRVRATTPRGRGVRPGPANPRARSTARSCRVRAVGTVYRAEADFTVDGIDILSVASPTRERKGIETLELLGSHTDEPLVTTTLARDERSDRKGGTKGRDRKGGKDGDRRHGSDRRPRGSGRPKRELPEVPPPPSRPKAQRLRAGRAHRKAVPRRVAARAAPRGRAGAQGRHPGGPHGGRAAERAASRPTASPRSRPTRWVRSPSRLLPRLRAAEWHDHAEAAVAQLDEVDLRDLRSVVTAADRRRPRRRGSGAGGDAARRPQPPDRRGAPALDRRPDRRRRARSDRARPAPQLASGPRPAARCRPS